MKKLTSIKAENLNSSLSYLIITLPSKSFEDWTPSKDRIVPKTRKEQSNFMAFPDILINSF